MLITEKFQEGSKWVARVFVDDKETTMFFKFDKEPSDSDAAKVVDQYKASMAAVDGPLIIKREFLYALENAYVDFLVNKWTPCLIEKKLIKAEDVITVENTDELTNVTLLFQLRALDFEKYALMAGEFDRLKRLIIENGGIMKDVKFHPTP